MSEITRIVGSLEDAQKEALSVKKVGIEMNLAVSESAMSKNNKILYFSVGSGYYTIKIEKGSGRC